MSSLSLFNVHVNHENAQHPGPTQACRAIVISTNLKKNEKSKFNLDPVFAKNFCSKDPSFFKDNLHPTCAREDGNPVRYIQETKTKTSRVPPPTVYQAT